jgi:hypothetical protein
VNAYPNASLHENLPPLSTLPLNTKRLLMIAARIHSLLRASRRNAICAPILIAASCQVAISIGKARSSRHSAVARQCAADNSALALGRAQSKAGVGACCSEGCACAGGVPCAFSDDAALLAAVDENVEEPAAAEGCAGCGCGCGLRRTSTSRDRSCCSWGRGAASILWQVFDTSRWACRLCAIRV